jgi:hypothetical protein
MEKQELKKTWSEILKTINETNSDNAYDSIVSFYQHTRELHNQLDKIKKIPIQKPTPTKPSFIEKVFQHKKAKEIQGNARKTQEERQEEKDKFCRLIASIPYMQTYGYVRAKNGEQITKDNVLSAGAIGYGLLPISKFESMKDTDPKAYGTITNQIVRFIEGSKLRFNKVNTDWF